MCFLYVACGPEIEKKTVSLHHLKLKRVLHHSIINISYLPIHFRETKNLYMKIENL